MKLRQILTSTVIVLAFILGCVYGYYQATKNTEFMLSAYKDKLNMSTLKYLEDKELDKIRSVHTLDLEASISGVKGAVEMEKYSIRSLCNLYYYYKLYDVTNLKEQEFLTSCLRITKNINNCTAG